MNGNENKSDLHSAAYRSKEDELFRRLMPELGMDAAAPSGHYRRMARLRYLLPRVAGLILLCVLWTLAMWYLSLGAQISDMRVEEGPEGATVEFSVNRVLLLESVTATLDGSPVAVEWDTIGDYRVSVDKNGELNVTARTFTGAETSKSTSISAVDDEPPHISSHNLTDGTMYIYLTDAGTGVNWDSLRAMDARTGEDVAITTVDRDAGFFAFPFPESSVRIYVEDGIGNDLTMLLELLSGTDSAKAQPGDSVS